MLYTNIIVNTNLSRMERDTYLNNLRPPISIQELNSSPEEEFQNYTLRPILKFQNDFLMAIFVDYMKSNKISLEGLNDSQRNLIIEKSIKQNIVLQTMLKGIIIGLFNTNEIEFWRMNKQTLNKRLVQLLIKRIQTQVLNFIH